jgi:hypothetical protein
MCIIPAGLFQEKAWEVVKEKLQPFCHIPSMLRCRDCADHYIFVLDGRNPSLNCPTVRIIKFTVIVLG